MTAEALANEAAADRRRSRARADDRCGTRAWRAVFILAALTGARVSELLAITWADVRLEDLDGAEIQYACQVDRRGDRRPTKTDGSARTVPIPRALAAILVRHRLASRYVGPEDYVFATRIGGPRRQRNVGRALRAAQQAAVDDHGRPTFPALHRVDADGRPTGVTHGELPSMHSFRHTVASRALLAGESVDEIAFLLGHHDANITRADLRARAGRHPPAINAPFENDR